MDICAGFIGSYGPFNVVNDGQGIKYITIMGNDKVYTFHIGLVDELKKIESFFINDEGLYSEVKGSESTIIIRGIIINGDKKVKIAMFDKPIMYIDNIREAKDLI